MTMTDVTELGPRKAAEMALELAWKDAKAVYLSFDIDSIDPAFAPGTGTPEPGGLLPREALEMVRLIAREGLCAMEVVEISPPYDVNDNTPSSAAASSSTCSAPSSPRAISGTATGSCARRMKRASAGRRGRWGVTFPRPWPRPSR